MRYPASEKLEIIRLVERSHLPVRRTLDKLGIPATTFYRWYDRYRAVGETGLEDRTSGPGRVSQSLRCDISSLVPNHLMTDNDELRERTRAEGDSVALSGAYRETLTRHAVLLKQAAAFRARPDDFASLLAQRGGIGRKDLDAFEELHARARRHRRAATMRHVHRIKRETEQEGVEPEMRQEETASVTPAERIQPVRPRHDSAQSRAHPETPNTPPVAAAVRDAEPVKP